MRNLAVSGRLRIKSTSSSIFWKTKPFLAHHTTLVGKSFSSIKCFPEREKRALSLLMKLRKVRARVLRILINSGRAPSKRMTHTYPGLTKKKNFYFITEVCQASRGLVFTVLVFFSLETVSKFWKSLMR